MPEHADTVRVNWCRTCGYLTLPECVDDRHDHYEARVVPLIDGEDGT